MPGTPELLQAIVVGVVRYGETSRIIRLATREQGVVASLAKGAARPRSPFPGLQLLAAGTAHLIPSRGELSLLSRFDLTDAHLGVAASMEAFRAGNVLAEVSSRAFPQSPQEEAFEVLEWGLSVLSHASGEVVDVLALAAIWRLAAVLGARPSLDFCAADGKAIVTDGVRFSIDSGGVLCPSCASGGGTARLQREDVDAIAYFLSGEGEPPVLDHRHAAAHRRLLGRWIRRHVVDGTLPALGLWVEGDDTAKGPR